MNKMVINHLDKLFVTNDAATIMKELEVAHPAAKLLVLASQQQEIEVGDATNFVIVFAGELLSKAEHLLRIGLHTADVIEGYEKALKKVLELLDGISVDQVADVKDATELSKAVRTAVGSKQYGYDRLITDLVVKAAIEIMPANPTNFNVDSVRVVKIFGGSIHDSKVLRGMLFNREPEGDIKKVLKAKVAIYTCALEIQQTETKGTVLIKNAGELLNFSKDEEKMMEKQLKEIADSGVNVIVTGSGINDMALHFINRMGLFVIKILSKFELRRLSKVTGATPLTRLGAPLPEEMGHCDVVEAVEIGSDRCTIFRQESEKTRTSTIVLRGGTQNMLDDLERAVDDGVNVVKAITKDPRLVAGAGAAEIELARQLMAFGEKSSGISSHAIKAFAEALEVIPRTLAENAGYDATEIVSKLYAAHEQGKRAFGVNIENEESGVMDVIKDIPVDGYPILDALSCKYWALKLSTDAALTLLRVDQIIMSKPAGGPKMPKGGNQFQDDD